MKIKIIKSETEYESILSWVGEMFDQKTPASSATGEQVQIALLLIKQYEDEHYHVPFPDPIDAIKAKMAEKGLKNKDLIGKVGSKGYISALLNKRKPLPLELARVFHRELGIPAEILLS